MRQAGELRTARHDARARQFSCRCSRALQARHQLPRKLISMPRKNVSSGSPYEGSIGFSRAVRIGNTIAVSGTAPVAPDGSVAAVGDVYGQARRCLEIIRAAVEDAG